MFDALLEPSQQLRICYLYQYFTTPSGSWSTRVYELARRWVAAGHQVTVVTSVYDKSDLRLTRFSERLEVEGIDVRVINVGLSNKHNIAVRLWTFLVYAAVASWYALTVPADVVIASSGPITVGIPGLVARWLRRRPLVFEVRDLWPEGAIQLGLLRARFAQRAAHLFARLCYRQAAVVVALSPGMAEGVLREVPSANVVVVPNACDVALFGAPAAPPAFDWADPSRLIVYAGSTGLMDDCSQIIDAASELQKRGRGDIQLALLGDGSQRPMLEERVARDGLTSVHFLGLLKKVDVVSWLQHARCALVVFKAVPVLDTGSPNKLFDALAAGTPVIQTTQGWIRGMLEREGCGLTVPPNDAPSMADSIQRLVDEPALRAEMAANARRVAKEQFDRDLLAARMLEVLREAAGEGP